MEEHFTDRKGVISSNGIGYFLRQPAGRMLMGAGFERAGTVQHQEQWRVVMVDQARFETELTSVPDKRGVSPGAGLG
jgi:hypothetical protein